LQLKKVLSNTTVLLILMVNALIVFGVIALTVAIAVGGLWLVNRAWIRELEEAVVPVEPYVPCEYRYPEGDEEKAVVPVE
jgi:hypothetical protein